MSKEELIIFLENYKRWHRGEDCEEQPYPELIEVALDYAVEFLKGNIK